MHVLSYFFRKIIYFFLSIPIPNKRSNLTTLTVTIVCRNEREIMLFVTESSLYLCVEVVAGLLVQPWPIRLYFWNKLFPETDLFYLLLYFFQDYSWVLDPRLLINVHPKTDNILDLYPSPVYRTPWEHNGASEYTGNKYFTPYATSTDIKGRRNVPWT